MWIDSLTYGPISGGRNVGLMAFHAHFSGEPITDDTEAAEAVIVLRDQADKSKIIDVSGEYSLNNSPYMLTFLKALKDAGFRIIVTTAGEIYHTWFVLVDYLIVRITDRPWVGFKCNELIYTLVEPNSVEPVLPPEVETGLFLVESELGFADVLKFVRKSQYPWGMYMPVEAPRIDLLGGTDD